MIVTYRPVLPQSGVSATGTRLPVDIRRFPWIKPLAADYAFEFRKLAPFFAGDPADPAAWRDTIARVQKCARQRDSIADVIAAQQTRRNAPAEAVAATTLLRDPSAVAVVTGQQAGLFGGPLYTLLKALSAVQIARRIEAEHGVAAVPIFWVDAEDHDWNEIKRCSLYDVDLNLASATLDDPPGANLHPVARVPLDASADRAVGELERLLAPTEFTAELLAQIRAAYRPGVAPSVAFAAWLETVLGPRGLVVFDASDPAAKPLVADLFVAELSHPGRTVALARKAGAALEACGYHAQAALADGSIALFQIDDGRTAVSPDTPVDQVRRSPASFSPNVLLRPLVQDTLFPTVCYVAGPSELAYLGQLKEVYAAFGVPMPLIHQRASATIVDSNALRFLTKHHVAIESLRAQDEGVLNALLSAQLPPEVESSVEAASRTLAERMDAIARASAQVDVTLEGAAQSALGRMQDDLKKLHGKIIQATKRKDETLRRQFTHAQAQAFPGGHPQERTIGFVYFLNKFGPSLIDRLVDELPLEMGQHWVITI